jgi:hypothetical protein
MRKAVLGMLLCLGILIVAFFIAVRWPALFWLTILAWLLYLAFGRRAEVEFRAGLGESGQDRQFYVTVVLKQRMVKVEGSTTTTDRSSVSSESMRTEVPEVNR